MISPIFDAAFNQSPHPYPKAPGTPRRQNYWLALCVLLGATLLAAEPALWLLRSWSAPAYDSQGEWLALLALGLLTWSVSSPLLSTPSRRRGVALLLATAVIRLIGQRLAINTVSAVALVIDAYAIALLLGTAHRRRAISPFWLALLFACTLPLEHLLQRIGGYGLQQLSTSAACSVLQLFTDQLVCGNDRIALGGKELLVDLPCSGARGLLALVALFFGIAALRRPTWQRAVTGLLITLTAAVIGNALRLAAIAALWAGGVDSIMAKPWHGVIGITALLLSTVPLLLWARQLPNAAPKTASPRNRRNTHPKAYLAAPLFPLLAFVVLATPAKPLDIAAVEQKASLPYRISSLALSEGRLSSKEQQYFNQWGGGARRGYYGPYTLLTVSTRAPLRHLHNPAACLGGNGNTLTYLGQRQIGLPSAEYLLTDREGSQWQVLVSYVSDSNEWATDVATVSWHWLRGALRGQPERWTMLQRIAPINHSTRSMNNTPFSRFNNSLISALDLSQPPAAADFQTPASLALQ